MSDHIRIPYPVLYRTTCEALAMKRSLGGSRGSSMDDTSPLDLDALSDEDLADIRIAAEAEGAKKFLRAYDAVLAARSGESDWKVPSFEAFAEMLRRFLLEKTAECRLYEVQADGEMLPWVMTSIKREENHRTTSATPRIILAGAAYGPDEQGQIKLIKKTWFFEPGEVSRRSVDKILAAAGLHLETPELQAAHDDACTTFFSTLETGFASQMRITGPVMRFARASTRRDHDAQIGHKAIMDIDEKSLKARPKTVDSDPTGARNVGLPCTLPVHPILRVYDLALHEFCWVHVSNLAPYEYQPQLREKLILPDVQRNLLDILTTDTEMLTDDIVEGKSAGNVILTKGPPGVGKTLTAEIYAEVCRKPLYAVHAGMLGTTPREVAEELRGVFTKAQRWKCVLLLDEADVFVLTRGRDVVQNAITAEFLRVLEYFDGLLFMTTNRGDDIDEAILSRCAAIIHYDAPAPEHARRLWQVLSDNFSADLDAELIDALVGAFPEITGRDIKMLLRLCMRVSQGHGRPLDLDLFRECAMFRGINAKTEGMAA